MSEAVVFIPLTKGHVAVIDFEDFEKVRGHKWQAAIKKWHVYASRSVKHRGQSTTVYMHRVILPGVSRVDHKDGDGLNNRRENLRPATKQQNACGFQHKSAGATSKFRGVHWDAPRAKWKAKTKLNGVTFELGRFNFEEDAARAYDTFVRKNFGDFVNPNFPK